MSKLIDRIVNRIARQSPETVSSKVASGWWMYRDSAKPELPEYKTTTVGFGKSGVEIVCQVADNDELQQIGLQKHAGLNAGEGMAFPYDAPRKVAFHMGDVSFPIDIIFVNTDSRVAKIVEAEPGTRETWSMPHTVLVVETPGGFCKENNISVGTDVYEIGQDIQAQVRSPGELSGDEAVQWDLREENWPSTPADGEWQEIEQAPIDSQKVNMDGLGAEYMIRGRNNNIFIDAKADGRIVFYDIQDEEHAIIIGEAQLDDSGMIRLTSFGEDLYDDHDNVLERAFNKEYQSPPREISNILKRLRRMEPHGEVTLMRDSVNKFAQETFKTDHVRRDINPLMQPGNPTKDRFKDRDSPDIVTDGQPMDTDRHETEGYDVTRDMSDEVAPVRPSR